MDYKVAVLGAGPGGYVAAIRAAQLGAKVCLIEKENVGGTCLNWGCIPTKSLLASAEIYSKFEEANQHGITIDNINVDLSKMVQRKDGVVKQLVNGVKFLVKKNKIDLIKGHAKFLSSKEIKVDTEKETKYISADNVIIATGTSPALPKFFGYDGKTVCSSNEGLNWNQVPKKLVVIGGGVIGCEFANLYNTLGTEVTIVELLPSILANLDEELANATLKNFKKKGIKVYTDVSAKSINKKAEGADVVLSNGETISCDKVLISIGRKTNIDDINLEYLGLKLDDKGRKILVDEHMRTNVEGVYAIGDVCSTLYDLAHVASREGIVAVENIMGKDSTMDYHAIPSCVYTHPELASVGMTEKEAKEKGYKVKLGRFNFVGNGKALSMGEPNGFIKLVVDAESDILLGAQMFGAHTTDLIAEVGVVIQNKGKCSEIVSTIHAHPTIAETVYEAAEDVYGLAIHA